MGLIKRVSRMVLIVVILLPGSAFAAPGKVSVSLPSFNVQLNDIIIDNTYSHYPLIVYKDITYFPMTFYVSRLMGLETEWSPASGLHIKRTGVVAEYRGYESDSQNARTYQASVPTFKITINGKTIDNAKEEYPLLIFRDITYFPLTWRFAVDAFDWDYHFDQSTGLSIKSRNIPVQKLELPYEKEVLSGIGITDGYYYYVGEDNGEVSIYRAPMSVPGGASKVYTIGQESQLFLSPLVGFFKMNNEVYFSYRTGGAVMGSNVYGRVNADGVGEKVLSGKMKLKVLGEDQVAIDYGIAGPFPGNLYHRKSGEMELKPIGNPSYVYGWLRRGEGSYSGNSSDLEIVDGWVYVIAFENENKNDTNKIHKVNIQTGETLLVSDIPASNFSIMQDKIYLINSEDGLLYTTALNGEQAKTLINTAIADYVIDADTVYYVSKESRELFSQNDDGTTQAMMPKKRVASIQIFNGYPVCVLYSDEAYGLVVFDKKDNQVFKTSDRVASAFVVGNLLVYKTYESLKNYLVRLP